MRFKRLLGVLLLGLMLATGCSSVSDTDVNMMTEEAKQDAAQIIDQAKENQKEQEKQDAVEEANKFVADGLPSDLQVKPIGQASCVDGLMWWQIVHYEPVNPGEAEGFSVVLVGIDGTYRVMESGSSFEDSRVPEYIMAQLQRYSGPVDESIVTSSKFERTNNMDTTELSRMEKSTWSYIDQIYSLKLDFEDKKISGAEFIAKAKELAYDNGLSKEWKKSYDLMHTVKNTDVNSELLTDIAVASRMVIDAIMSLDSVAQSGNKDKLAEGIVRLESGIRYAHGYLDPTDKNAVFNK